MQGTGRGTQEAGREQGSGKASPIMVPALWEAFEKWFKQAHPGDWSRRDQLPEWRAFQAGAKAADEANL